MSNVNRRNFLRTSGLSVLPVIIPGMAVHAAAKNKNELPTEGPIIKFYGDSDMMEPDAYIEQLRQLNNKKAIDSDFYGVGGAVATLEKRFEEITGKEKSVFMPSGTMANQLAIAVLSGENTKVFVQETSHVYRDEADAAQSVFNKRLMPLAKGETYFTAAVLKQALESLNEEEVFKSGVGAVSIENPVRRSNGKVVPIEEIRKISEYCKSNNIKLHLDGARIYLASAWTGVSIKEYASYFDTVYISLYKYLGANAGAVLSGDKLVMNKMEHLMKIHGGVMFANWTNAAMALHKIGGIEEQLRLVVKRANELVLSLNKLEGISIHTLDGGTNIFKLQLSKEIDAEKLRGILAKEYAIRMPRADKNNEVNLMVNESLLYRDNSYILQAFSGSMEAAKK